MHLERDARLAKQREAHAAEVAPRREQLAARRTEAAVSADQARKVADDIAALKAALAVVHEEQKVQTHFFSIVFACPHGN